MVPLKLVVQPSCMLPALQVSIIAVPFPSRAYPPENLCKGSLPFTAHSNSALEINSRTQDLLAHGSFAFYCVYGFSGGLDTKNAGWN